MGIHQINLRAGLISGFGAKQNADPANIKRKAFWHDKITALFASQNVPNGPQRLGIPNLPSFFGGKKK